MAISRTQFRIFSLLFLFECILILSNSGSTTLLVHGEPCHGDFQGAITQCAGYVLRPGPRRDPSQGCCDVIKNIDFDCACGYVTADIERIIDMEKVDHVAEFCGIFVSPGMKCRSHDEIGQR